MLWGDIDTVGADNSKLWELLSLVSVQHSLCDSNDFLLETNFPDMDVENEVSDIYYSRQRQQW